MSYPHDIFCPTSITQPEPVAYCDFCQRKFYHRDLSWYYQYVGPTPKNQRFLVCRDDLDIPSAFLAPIVIRGKEGIVFNARPFITSPSEEAGGPQQIVSPNWPMADAIEGEADVGPIPELVPPGTLFP